MRVVVAAALVVVVAAAVAGARGAATYRPVVLMHGIFASAASMSDAQQWIEADFPGIHAVSVEVGNGPSDSLLMNMNEQVDKFAAAVRADPLLARGFNCIAHSQGGLVTRGYIERYNDPPVHNYITWASPHGGQYGVPVFNVDALDKLFSELLESTDGKVIESFVSFGSYWKDPYDYDKYLSDSIFLADINNERDTKNATYKQHIASLNTWLMEYSPIDDIVHPATSGWFQSFALNQSTTVVPLQQSAQYTEDWVGLRTLDSAGKLQLVAVKCAHPDFPRDACKQFYTQYTMPLLNNTLP